MKQESGYNAPQPIGPSEAASRYTEEEQAPYHIRLPGFVTEEEIGLGDVIKRATSYLGIPPCGGCQRRAEALNSKVVFKTSLPR